jgi:hypothetical protein
MDHISQRQTDILGYQISSRTKPQLISNWERLLYERVLSLHCAITIGEHRTFVYNPDGSVGAQKGRHDDTVTGCMLVGIGLVQAPKFALAVREMQPLPQKYGQGQETEAVRMRRVMEARRRNSMAKLKG